MTPSYLDSLKSAPFHPRAARVLADARERHVVLHDLATLGDIAAALADRSPGSLPRRNQLLLAILTEYQGSDGVVAQVWSQLLCQACLPMLFGISKALRNSTIKTEGVVNKTLTRDERESLVVEAFLTGASRLGAVAPELILHALRRRARKEAFALLNGATTESRTEVPTDDDAIEAGMRKRNEVDHGPRHFQDQLRTSAPQVRALLFRWLGAAFPADQLEVIADTVLSGREVSELVRERHVDASPADRRRLESRLHQAKERILPRLRRALDSRFQLEAIYAGQSPVVS